MTDRIDLDELGASDEEEEEEERGNRGDWLWREDDAPGDGDDGQRDEVSTDADRAGTSPSDSGTDTTDRTTEEGPEGSDDGSPPAAADPVPHVPRSNRDRPAGVPESGGGAGVGAGSQAGGDPGRSADAADAAGERDTLGETGPHGGGVDDMTVAFTYRAARRLADPAAAVADASSWADWIGIVGDVPAHVINKFQREHVIDADFFNGSGTGPGERLAEIGPNSMFYAERMVVVGVPDEEGVAEAADWEFVPLAEAAEGAGWTLRDTEEG
jgi:hypothetical protein